MDATGMSREVQPGDPLSPVQARVLERLREWYGEDRSVGLSSVAEEMGMTLVSFMQHIRYLHRKGYVYYESRGRGRRPIVRPEEQRVEVDDDRS